MIKIDKFDKLYAYLTGLGVENVDELYTELANNGRYLPKDVFAYFYDFFSPSNVADLDESELQKVLDYYVDLKKTKHLRGKALQDALIKYKQTGDIKLKHDIINSQLKDVLYMCLNYSTLHKSVDLQDVVQLANIGLINAVEKFDARQKIAFKDYIVYWTRFEILKEFGEEKNA